MGAPSDILKGELWLLKLINSIEESPLWNSTAVFITWDDPGGYYDQVPPPVFHGVQLGMRLPLIVVSTYAKEDYKESWGFGGSGKTPIFREEIHGLPPTEKLIDLLCSLIINVQNH